MSDNAISCAETAQQKKKNIFPINETIVRQKNSTVKGHTKNILVRSLIFFPLLCLRGLRFKVRNMLCRLFGRLVSLLIFSIYKQYFIFPVKKKKKWLTSEQQPFRHSRIGKSNIFFFLKRSYESFRQLKLVKRYSSSRAARSGLRHSLQIFGAACC